jgi:hypothetical protein
MAIIIFELLTTISRHAKRSLMSMQQHHGSIEFRFDSLTEGRRQLL